MFEHNRGKKIGLGFPNMSKDSVTQLPQSLVPIGTFEEYPA